MRAVTVLLNVVCWLVIAEPEQQRVEHSRPTTPRSTQCGPLALYGLLIASGYDIEYARVVKALGSTPGEPVTLRQLLTAGRRLGFDVRLGHGPLSECITRAPVLLCQPADPVGHAVLMRRLSSDLVELADPTGTVIELPAHVLARDTRTYPYLYLRQHAELEAAGVALVGFCVSWIVLSAARCLGRSRSSRSYDPVHQE